MRSCSRYLRLAVYGLVGAVVGVESLGIPLPGEIVLVSAALLSSRHELAVNPVGVGAAAVIGAVMGDSTGYAIGRRLGLPLFDRLGRRFPNLISVPGMSCSPNGCLTAGARRPFSSGALSRCCGYSPGHSPAALKMRYARFPRRKRVGRVVLGGGRHRAGVGGGHSHRTLADSIFLDRATSRRGVRGDCCNRAARAHIPRDCRPRGRALRRVRPHRRVDAVGTGKQPTQFRHRRSCCLLVARSKKRLRFSISDKKFAGNCASTFLDLPQTTCGTRIVETP